METKILTRKEFNAKIIGRVAEQQKKYPKLYALLSNDIDLAVQLIAHTLYDYIYVNQPENKNYISYVKFLNEIYETFGDLNSDIVEQEIERRQQKKIALL